MKHIGVIDCNNFFVSCERLFRPDLKNKPVVVLSSNDGCIVARSNEVKALGIPMGVPYFKVREELKAASVVVFSSNFTLYRDISRRVMAVLKQHLDTVEQYSVDEAFFEIEGEDDNRLLEVLQHLKQAVETNVGVPISIGVGRTKTIAKYAVEKNKRTTGLCVLTGKHWQQETATIQLSEIWGIGGKTSIKMRQHDLHTVADFLATDPARIDKLFGIAGLRQRDELMEKSVYALGTDTEHSKSITSTRSFKSATSDRKVVEDAIAYHVAHAAEELREYGLKARYIQVIAQPSRHGDWVLRSASAEQLLDQATHDTRLLLKSALELFDRFFDPLVPYKKAGVVLGSFMDETIDQKSLFAVPDESNSANVMTVLDELNHRYGAGTLTIGSRGQTDVWQSSKEHVSKSYTTKWADIPTIKAI